MSESRFVRAVLMLPVADMKHARAWYVKALDFETCIYAAIQPTSSASPPVA